MSPTEPLKYKTKLVVKGFTQRKAIDYNEIFSPVVKFKTIHMIFVVVVQFDLELEQMDVKTAFLHGDLEECIYMVQPTRYIDHTHPEHICLLKKKICMA